MSRYGTQVADEMLLKKLDACATLRSNEREAVQWGQARYVELGHLPKSTRDQLWHIAKAYKLFKKTEAKGAATPQPMNINGDPFSTRPGPIDARAAAQIGKIPAPIRKAG